MLSRTTAILFATSVIIATVVMWTYSDHSVANTLVFLLAMLFGGSVYFLKARG